MPCDREENLLCIGFLDLLTNQTFKIIIFYDTNRLFTLLLLHFSNNYKALKYRERKKSIIINSRNINKNTFPKMGQSERQRSNSFALVDETQASGILTDVLAENNVFLGGSSLGKGLPKAARYHLKQKHSQMEKPNHLNLPGSKDIVENAEIMPIEESFYILDLGVVVSQVYQCKN